jgi:hypothetical protein
MMTLSSRAAATAFATLLLMSSAFAQTPATPAPGATPAPAATAAPKEKKANNPQSPASLECSKEAEAKDIHGKDRHKFMRKCKRAAKEAAAAAAKK